MANHTTARVIRDTASFALCELSFPCADTTSARAEALQYIYPEILMAGAGTYDRAAFIDTLAQYGISLSVSCDGAFLRIRIRSRNETIKKALTLLTTLLTQPTFTPKELTRIQKRLVEEIKLAKEDAKARAYQQFVNTLVSKEDHRYEHDLDAVRAEIPRVTVKELRTFHTQTLTNGAYITVGGTATQCAVVEKALRQFEFKKYTTSEHRGTLQLTTRTLHVTDIPHKQNIEFSIGGSLPLLYTHPDFAALYFGMCVLGIQGGFSGRLMSIVREKEGLTYGIYGNLESVTATQEGFWRIATFFAPKDAATGITSTLREIERIRTRGITEDELTRFKTILGTRFALTSDSLIRQTKERHSLTELGITPHEFDAFKAAIQGMTRVRVHAALKQYLDPKHCVISGAGPTASIEKSLRTLLSGA